jgi:energy-coupling factor transport system substrate-specific component
VSWVVASFAILALALATGFAWYEREHPTTRVLALVATLAALAALGRVAFAPLPNVKPTTDIVLLSGYVLGGAPGFMVGAVAALASNLFFGQGPWTPWQMVAWGACGLVGAGLARVAGRELGRFSLATACALAGLAFGAVMNLSLWVMYSGDHTAPKLAATFGGSLPFDIAHAAGNATFCLIFGPALVRALARFRTRMEVDWRPAPAVAGTAAVVLAALVVALPAPPAHADATATAARSAESWLLKAQNDDGGWGAAPGQASGGLYTGWAALGVAAAGTNPRDAGKPSVIAWLRAHPGDVSDLGEVSRTVLVLRAAGLPGRLGGRDLVGELAGAQRPDGSFAGRVNTTAFALLALRAAGRSRSSRPVRRAATWLAGQANADGGFNFGGKGGPSGVDDTGAALQALAAAGRRGSAVTQAAATWLAGRQNADGGYPLLPGAASNAQSTAWAIQGLLAAGRDPAKIHKDGSRDPLAYLRSLTSPSGEIRYSRTSRQTPVWVTGQAVMALARKPLPLKPVKRARKAATHAPGGGGPAATNAAGSGAPPARASGGSSPPAPPAASPPTAAPLAGEASLPPAKRRLRANPASRPGAAVPPAPVLALVVAASSRAGARSAGSTAGLVAALLSPGAAV